MQHIPYRGSPQGVMALLQNDIQLFTVGYAAGVGHLKDGKFTALAVATDARLPELPDMPTLIESGLPGFTGANWWGMAAPAGTPEPVIRKLREAVQAALREPNVIERYKAIGLVDPERNSGAMGGRPEGGSGALVRHCEKRRHHGAIGRLVSYPILHSHIRPELAPIRRQPVIGTRDSQHSRAQGIARGAATSYTDPSSGHSCERGNPVLVSGSRLRGDERLTMECVL